MDFMINLLSGPLYCVGGGYCWFYDRPVVWLSAMELTFMMVLWCTIRRALCPFGPSALDLPIVGLSAMVLRKYMIDFMIPAAGLNTVDLNLWWILWYAFRCAIATVYGGCGCVLLILWYTCRRALCNGTSMYDGFYDTPFVVPYALLNP